MNQTKDDGMDEEDNIISIRLETADENVETEANSEEPHLTFDDQQSSKPLSLEELNVKIRTAIDAVNEYDLNDDIIYTSLPLSRRCWSEKSGPLTKADTRHIFTQFSGVFGKTHRFLFSLFEQMHRHNTAENIASAVRNRPETIHPKLGVNDTTFLSSL